MKTAYLRFASISDQAASAYISAERFPVLTSDNFKIQKVIRDIPAMKVINAYRLPIGPDDEDQVQFVVENVTDEIFMLLRLAVAPDDFLEAW